MVYWNRKPPRINLTYTPSCVCVQQGLYGGSSNGAFILQPVEGSRSKFTAQVP
jgi:hypothetical protein